MTIAAQNAVSVRVIGDVNFVVKHLVRAKQIRLAFLVRENGIKRHVWNYVMTHGEKIPDAPN